MQGNSTAVALHRCPSYAQLELDDALARVLTAIKLPELRSAKVLLKPNLISAKHGSLPCTQADLLLAVARWLLACGAQVSIGDSPAFGTAAMVLQQLGIADKLTALDVEIKNFGKGRQVQLPDGGQVLLAEAALDCDLLVNLPKVKAHVQTRLTLAVKNCFGCVIGLRKAWWHMRYGGQAGAFHDRLAQLPQLLPPMLIVADGIVAMHKTGPLTGAPYPLALLAAATNPTAMDAALHHILGVPLEHSPVLAACRRAGISGAEPAQLTFPLAEPADFHVPDFIVPEQLNPVRFNPLRFLTSMVRRLLLQRQDKA